MISGEAAANAKWMAEGQWIEYAKQFGALCFQVEHRFYGQSHPTSDLGVKNLMFLSSQQALADLAYFIEFMNINYKLPVGTKWIAFGGSYAGSLAAWLRNKYPHLVHGAVSASGPLLAEIDFQEYFVVVENALKEYSEACVNAILEANKQFHIMLHRPIGQQGIAKKFILCDPINEHTKRNDISNLYETIASIFAGIVQYNKDNRNNSAMANLTIDSACDILTNETLGIAIDRLAILSTKILQASEKKCLDYMYNKMIHKLRNITWASEEAEGGRQWTYQTCTEFGFFQTSTARGETRSRGSTLTGVVISKYQRAKVKVAIEMEEVQSMTKIQIKQNGGVECSLLHPSFTPKTTFELAPSYETPSGDYGQNHRNYMFKETVSYQLL
ncbi:putative serine protease F56F10.1 [Bombus pascuorum]|uniref:putative serine protease F56F10.1 n=1 Tax=Bombus pascuorum TaxID=65598 RepID=UPI00298DDCFF|nr:putative serine protease F56F10.1 [Bombus pascuorum]